MWVPTFQLESLLLNNCILNKGTGHGIPTFISTQRSLNTLELSHTSLKGTIPSWLLYNVTIDSLSLRGNFLDDPFPKPTHHNMSTLRGLDISNNSFSGEFPPNIDTLFPNLFLFNMSTNELQGAIPLSLSKLQKLETLDLSQNKLFGEMPEGLIGNNTSLRYLKLSNNELHGNILSKNWNTSALVVLLLDNNEFTGTIASNMLRGPSLIVLDLRGNKLSVSFQSLENIESLDLSHNKLVGMIPPQMVQLHSLSTFSVAFNNLSGAIPHEKQFLIFDESSYTGNDDLCGPPLHRNCTANNPSQTRDNKEEEEDDSGILDRPMFFYLLVAISYALGF
ncbi:Leucine-rich repeat-containing protein [Cinnamomum micranthum f. kanehirae]|uniref:Leucine-rich repeat-containing protein n=1 Tax=Cinnamomum micranthum f. kanehirae TaxID=337451 RepID=A0A3S4N942_9MAGN|nr:Leucine-rich repeat-containing protein [Cinnamomum micranthum f. kanehirae]